MLSFLRIHNVALIDKLEIEFDGGLGLLTGETGSGKSIIVDSLGALAGGRVTNDLIKQGTETATIEGAFKVSNESSVWTILEKAGIDAEPDSELLVRRDISLTGKNRVFINGQLTTAGVLKNIGDQLVDIHGQGEQASLYDVEQHRVLLDEMAGHNGLLNGVAQAYAAWSNANSMLSSLRHDENEKLQLIDILSFQLNEIGRANLVEGEDDELEIEKRRLVNSEKLATLSDDLFKTVYDNEAATFTTLERAAKLTAELGEYDPGFHEFDSGLKDAIAVIDELARSARDYGSKIEYSPERIAEIENRLAEIGQLKRKYGGTISAILEHLSASQTKLSELQENELKEEELQKRLALAYEQYAIAADELHLSRQAAAKRLSKSVENGLKELALERAVFEVRIEKSETNISPNGSDLVEFYFSANPGEPPRPLVRVASGGEASRLMLTVKNVISGNDPNKTSVFDEVDTGIGGRVAEAVGRRLKSLAASQQVLCVTHQPQIAALADQHFLVEKRLGKASTAVTISSLGESERIDEVARMLAGESITEAARENARSLIAMSDKKLHKARG